MTNSLRFFHSKPYDLDDTPVKLIPVTKDLLRLGAITLYDGNLVFSWSRSDAFIVRSLYIYDAPRRFIESCEGRAVTRLDVRTGTKRGILLENNAIPLEGECWGWTQSHVERTTIYRSRKDFYAYFKS